MAASDRELFGLALQKLIEESIEAINYRPQRFIQMVQKRGPIAAVQRLIHNAGGESTGLDRLAQAGRLDLSVENLILQPQWRRLFTPEQLSIAETTLLAHGFAPTASPAQTQHHGPSLPASERYWCEVTDRTDVGSDLNAPQRDEGGQVYWSYSLIAEVVPGDIVFHYSTREKAFVGASVAGGPMEERPITWTPHGTVGRAKTHERAERPGYWRPLYGYRAAPSPLTLSAIAEGEEATWLRSWVDANRGTEALRLPFQLRRDGIRAGQGYLFKMPPALVERWAPLRELAEGLDDQAEALSARVLVRQPDSPSEIEGFKPKSDSDYTAVITATVQHRTRTHERLVRVAGEWLQGRGVLVDNTHPKDLEILSPVSVIFEAKAVRQSDPLFAIREAVGQLHEYRYFVGPRNAAIAVLLDVEPPDALVTYAENYLQVAVFWLKDGSLSGGPLAHTLLLDKLVTANVNHQSTEQ